MKNLCLILFGLIALLRADEAPLPHYLLVAPASMDALPVERVQGWMQANLHYPVQVLRRDDWEGESAEAQAEALLPLPTDAVIVTVVLSARLDEGKHAVILPDAKIGFVNVPLLLEDSTAEKELRRLDRQAMRIVGFTLGIPPQPMPFCALAPYRSLEELDRMGRGFSPPAMALYRSQLVKHGIPLSEEAEKLLPDVRVNLPIPPQPEN